MLDEELGYHPNHPRVQAGEVQPYERHTDQRLFERLPNLRLDPEAHDVHITGRGFRSPRELPVLFG